MANIVFWGTYDKTKPRNRILLSGLRDEGHQVAEIHGEIWSKEHDKSQEKRMSSLVRTFLKIMASYPKLVWRLYRLKSLDAVVVGYPGYLDILICKLALLLSKRPVIVWDIFISLYNTVVEDRQLIAKSSLLAKLIFWWEAKAVHLPDILVTDTKAHGDYFVDNYLLPQNRVKPVFVGAEGVFFHRPPQSSLPRTQFRVLFYGTFIPLHGLETIVLAAHELRDEPIEFVIVGKGQEQDYIDSLIIRYNLTRVTRVEWIDYPGLVELMDSSDVCLGVFGNTKKGLMVIPNKVYQIVARGRPLITQDSPAIRELFSGSEPGVWLTKPGDYESLAKAVLEAYKENLDGRYHQEKLSTVGETCVARQLIAAISASRSELAGNLTPSHK